MGGDQLYEFAQFIVKSNFKGNDEAEEIYHNSWNETKEGCKKTLTKKGE